MLPGDGTLTDPFLPADFLWKMRSAADPLTDYEVGGDALKQGDPLDTQTWTFGYAAPDVWVGDAAGTRTVLFSKPGITELAGAFDQNMNPFAAYVDAAGAHFWWFDTNAGAQVFSDMAADVRNPRCCMDERRPMEIGVSDIILAYTRGTGLYYRQQRDRFATEYQLQADCGGTLESVGMNTGLRLQFKVRPADY